MDKKGQDMSISTLILLVLGVVVLIVIVLGFTQGFGFFTDMFGKADIDATVIQQKCGSTGVFGGAICTDRIEVGSDKYITCGYAANNLSIAFDGDEKVKVTCKDIKANSKTVCGLLKLKAGDKFDGTDVEVNGEKCSFWNPVAPVGNVSN